MPFPQNNSAGTTLKSSTISQINHLFNVGDWIYYNGTAWALADADAYASSQAIGVIEAGGVIDADNFIVTYDGLIDLTGASYAPLTPGSNYYLDTTAGVATETAISGIYKALFTATSTTGGYIVQGQGQTAVMDYGYFTATGTQTIGPAATDITFTNTWSGQGNIPITSAGVVTLTAGKTYELTANIANIDAGPADFVYQFVDSGTNVAVGTNQPIFNSIPATSGQNASSVPASFIYTPSTNQTIKLRCQSSNGAADIVGTGTIGNETPGSFWSIKQIGASPVPMSLAGEYGVVPFPTATSLTLPNGVDTDILSVTLPTAGTWEVTYEAGASSNTQGVGISTWLADSSNNPIANTAAFNWAGNATSQSNGSTLVGTAFITTTGPATYKLRGRSTSPSGGALYNSGASLGASTSGNTTTRIIYKKVSGFLPSSGQTVDYVNVYRDDTTAFASGNPIVFNQTASGNIPYNTTTGLFSLTAGKTYKLSVNAQTGTAGNVQWQTSAGTPLNTSFIGSSAANSVITYDVTYTPSVNTDVKVQVTSGTVTPTSANRVSAVVTQLGSSNAITSTPSYVQIERHSASVTANDYTISTASSGNFYTVAAAGQRCSFTSANGTVVGGDFTIGTNQITINTAGTYDIRGLIAGEPTANSAVWAQLVLDGTTVLNASVQYAGGATFNSNVTTQYIGSFSAGATIDMRVGNPTGTTMGMHTTSLIIRRVIN